MADAKKKRAKRLPPELRVIGQRAHDIREGKGLTQKELARQLGINATQVSRFEKGERMPQLQTVLRLCRVLGAPVGYVVGGEGEPPVLVFEETDRRRLPKTEG